MNNQTNMDSHTIQVIYKLCNKDKDKTKDWISRLEEYILIEDDDEVPYGSFVRYADYRDIPIKLKYGGFVVDCDDSGDKIKLRIARRFWDISRKFCVIFRKKTKDDYILEAAETIIGSMLSDE